MPWPSFFSPVTLVKPADVIRRRAWAIVKLLRPDTGAADVRWVVLRVCTALGLTAALPGAELTEGAGVCAPAGPAGMAVEGVTAVEGAVVLLLIAALLPWAKAAPPMASKAAAAGRV